MSHIVSIKVRGLNGRSDELSFDLDRHVNVFFGLNGSGKTSLLRIIDSAMSMDAAKVAKTKFDSAEIVLFSQLLEEYFSLKIEKHASKNGNKEPKLKSKPGRKETSADSTVGEDEILPDERWQITPDPVGPSGRVRAFQHRFLPTSRLYTENRLSWRQHVVVDGKMVPATELAAEESLDDSFANSLQSIWSKKYADILRIVRTIQEDAIQQMLVEVLSSEPSSGAKKASAKKPGLSADSAFAKMSSFMARQRGKNPLRALGSRDEFERRYQNNASLHNIVNQIVSFEAVIEEKMKPIAQISELVRAVFSTDYKEVSFDGSRISVVSKDGESISLARLSSGEKHLIYMMLTVLDAGVSTLLIDEPELSLHIDWQRQLINYMRALNPECQIIVATHSPEIMADTADANIFRV